MPFILDTKIAYTGPEGDLLLFDVVTKETTVKLSKEVIVSTLFSAKISLLL